MTPSQIEQGRVRVAARLLAPIIRWTAERKHDVLLAIEKQLLTPEQVFATHGISGDELNRWRQAYERDGMRGLRANPWRRKAA